LLAGGAGVTPFIAILRKLYKDGNLKDNQLIFSNKSEQDIILYDEFKTMLGANFINTLPEQEQSDQFSTDLIDREFLQEHIQDFEQPFYICGPKGFVKDIRSHLEDLGAEPDALVFEK